MIRGLVIGKFYPPHRGHKYLIETARSQVDQLVVLICDPGNEQPPAILRAAWLREMHPDADVQIIPDIHDDDNSAAWAAHTRRFLGYAPDVVFTSEDYGQHYAHHLGCRHILVDRERVRFPISGRAIRQNPLAHWDDLEPCVRAYYAKRICVLGAESTGTTTLAQALAEHYHTIWVPEYGRDYWEQKMLHAAPPTPWHSDEFVHIAREQCRLEDAAARYANRLLICDTDAFATTIWHERYMGYPSPEVQAIADARRYDLYLLTNADIPFVQDGTRDGEHIRLAMHARFQEALEATGRPYLLLSGPHEARLRAAVAAVDEIVADKSDLQAS
jgi:HTH-type transcriptional repressor of NAD biosynthesis genes